MSSPASNLKRSDPQAKRSSIVSHLRVPPQNVEAESAIIGGLFLKPDAIDDVVDLLSPDDFYREANAEIYRVMCGLYDRGINIDVVAIADSLGKSGLLEKIGGIEYLAGLVESVGTAAGLIHHAGIVREASVRRRLIGHCSNTADNCYRLDSVVAELLDSAEQGIYDLAQARKTDGLQPASRAVREGFELIEHAGAALPGLDTGYADLNRLTGGLMPGDLIVIAARPSMGKTALALNIGVNAAKTGIPVAVFSLEMSRPQLGLRMIVSEARVDAAQVRAGHLQESDYQKLVMGANNINDLPIWIEDRSDITVLEIRAAIRRIRRKHDLGLVIVDYLQLMGSNRPGETREQEVSAFSRGLKAIAKQFHVPVIALSQLNRKVEDRPKKRPMLADLRESGAIEQDADVIAFIFRPEFYGRTDENRGLAEIIIAKQRNGPTDTIKMTFLEQFTRFEDYVREVQVP